MKIYFLNKLKNKKKNLKHLPFICVLFLSLQTFLGGILGFLLSEFYVKNVNNKEKKCFLPPSLFVPFPFLNWKLKIHHWFYGFFGLLVNLKLSLIESPFLLAILVGMAWHDVTDNRGDKWYRFLYRK
jgi:uncharacterized protein with ParB-like and HNH nuclease domain